MDFLIAHFNSFVDHARNVIAQPVAPSSRIFALYLLTSLLFAYFIYRKTRARSREDASSFPKFLFPAKVWRNPSAWLDVRYFFFHQMFGHFLLLGFGTLATLAGFQVVTGLNGFEDIAAATELTGWQGFMLSVGFMVVVFAVTDFIAFYSHYLQHKVPLLWQFHKVHHSAEVMHPLSNFREHPIDNFFYAVSIGAGYGVVVGVGVQLFGYVPVMPSLLGVPILMFLFNVTGYSLRHSHVWLRWPGVWSKVFPSPAHHHVHHSCHPDHLDKNFAFLFPVWDVIFGCYVMPDDNRDVKFGVTEKDNGQELNSCVKMYALPFRDAYRVLMRRRDPVKASSDGPDAPPSDQPVTHS